MTFTIKLPILKGLGPNLKDHLSSQHHKMSNFVNKFHLVRVKVKLWEKNELQDCHRAKIKQKKFTSDVTTFAQNALLEKNNLCSKLSFI